MKTLKMKKAFFPLLIIFFVSAYLFLFNAFSVSAFTIVSCETTDNPNTPCNLCEALQMVSRSMRFALFVVIPGAAAFAFMIGGAFLLFAGGNENNIKTGQGIIRVVIYGILIAFGSFIIVNTIISELASNTVNWSNNEPWYKSWYKVPNCAEEGTPEIPTIAQPDISVGSVEDEPEEAIEETGIILTDYECRKRLIANDIGINKKNCITQGQTNCTSCDSMPAQTIKELVDIKTMSGCDITMTGGTEAGHKTHGKGKNVVDVRSNDCLLDYLSQNTGRHQIEKICTTAAHSSKSYNCNYNEPQEHIHIKFKKICVPTLTTSC